MDEASKRQVTVKRRLSRAKKRAAKGKPPYFPRNVAVDQHALWAWSDTKFATLADVWPGGGRNPKMSDPGRGCAGAAADRDREPATC